MKYLITESQAKIAATFLKLDMKNFIQIKKDDDIYFVYSEEDMYAEIKYNISNGLCVIKYDLIDEISSFFSLQESDAEKVIGRWVENKIKMRVINTYIDAPLPLTQLIIPQITYL